MKKSFLFSLIALATIFSGCAPTLSEKLSSIDSFDLKKEEPVGYRNLAILHLSVANENIDSLSQLSHCYQSIKLLEKAAELGDNYSLKILSIKYQTGEDNCFNTNPDKAEEYLIKAAETGSFYSIYYLSQYYFDSRNGEESWEHIEMLVNKSIELNKKFNKDHKELSIVDITNKSNFEISEEYKDLFFNLKELTFENEIFKSYYIVQMNKYIEKSVLEDNNSTAAVILGKLYQHGFYDFKISMKYDAKKAEELFLKAENNGYFPATEALAFLYLENSNLKDRETVEKYLSKVGVSLEVR